MSDIGIETQPVDRGALISMSAAILTLLALCAGIAPLPFTGFVCFPAAAALGIVALSTGVLSLRRIRSSKEAGRTFALAGIVVGSVVLAATLCLLLLGIWMYPSLLELAHRLRL